MVDPAFGSAKGDSSVLAVIFTDDEGNRYIHHMEYIKITAWAGDDEAHFQCRIVADLIEKFYIPAVAIEINGIGRFLPGILRNVLSKRNLACAVLEKSSTKGKSERILEGFDTIMAAQSLWVHEDVKKTPFLLEMMEWQPNKKSAKDDGLDAASGALSLEPVRIKRHYNNARKRWHSHGQTHLAKIDFEVLR